MAIKMIAADMDGTILDNDKRISPETEIAVKAAMDAGAYVTLCSGRMLESVTPYSEQIHVNAPVICYNGALTYDERLGKAAFEEVISVDDAKSICRFAQRESAYVQCFWGGNFYYNEYCDKTEFYEKKAGVIGKKAKGILSENIENDCYKLLMIVNPGQMPELVKKARYEFSDIADFQPSSDTFLECVAKGVNKASALKRLCESLSITCDEVMTFGDEQNDLSMLEYAHYGYAMGNSPDSIKSRCRFLAPTNTENGVAKVIFDRLQKGDIGG